MNTYIDAPNATSFSDGCFSSNILATLKTYLQKENKYIYIYILNYIYKQRWGCCETHSWTTPNLISWKPSSFLLAKSRSQFTNRLGSQRDLVWFSKEYPIYICWCCYIVPALSSNFEFNIGLVAEINQARNLRDLLSSRLMPGLWSRKLFMKKTHYQHQTHWKR